MLSKHLDYIKQHPQFLSEYYTMLQYFTSSGLESYMREAGLTHLRTPAKDAHEAAVVGAYARGWLDALELLENFRELIYGDIGKEQPDNIRPDFGSLKAAVEKGDLTQEEADAIRNNTTPSYTITAANGSDAKGI